MSEHDEFSKHVEALAAEMGITAKCRLMHRPSFDDGWTGEVWPAYDEYEARGNGKYVAFDVEFATVGDDALRPLLEHLR